MTTARGTKPYVDMSGGIVTEASLLEFPQNASSDELNMLFDKAERKRVRRKGLESGQADFVESNLSVDATGGTVYDIFYWQQLELYAVAIIFQGTSTSSVDIVLHNSAPPYAKVGGITLDGATPERVGFATIRNNLVVAIEGRKPVMFVVNDAVTEATVSEVDLYVRDFNLLDDSLDVTERPPTLSEEHQYNLYNAGWYQNRFTTDSTKVRVDPIQAFAEGADATVTATGVFDGTAGTFKTFDSSAEQFDNIPAGTEVEVSGTSSNNGTVTFQSYSFDGGTFEYTITFDPADITDEDPSTPTFTINSFGYPSNADISYLGLVTSTDGDKLIFDGSFLQDKTFGNSPAPRGHYVFNIANFDRNTKILNKNADGAVDNTLTEIGSIPL